MNQTEPRQSCFANKLSRLVEDPPLTSLLCSVTNLRKLTAASIDKRTTLLSSNRNHCGLAPNLIPTESVTIPISKRIPIWKIWLFDNWEASKSAANHANTPEGQDGTAGKISPRIEQMTINPIEIPASDTYSFIKNVVFIECQICAEVYVFT